MYGMRGLAVALGLAICAWGPAPAGARLLPPQGPRGMVPRLLRQMAESAGVVQAPAPYTAGVFNGTIIPVPQVSAWMDGERG